jgi:hypothetical protein
MPKYKNYSSGDRNLDLKSADAEKSSESNLQHLNSELFGSKARAVTVKKPKDPARKKLPLAVDIIISILMVAIAVGVLVGTYFLFRYFTVDYESVSVEYTLLVEDADTESYSGVLNKHVYMDVDGNTVYCGKIIAVESYEKQGAVVLNIALSAKYKSEEGYFADDSKIAVGKSYNLRTDEKNVSGTIVELVKKSSPKKVKSLLNNNAGSVVVSMMGGVD